MYQVFIMYFKFWTFTAIREKVYAIKLLIQINCVPRQQSMYSSATSPYNVYETLFF